MKHNLQEMHTKSYPKRTEKNVIDFDGTVIFTHGKLTGGSLLTQEKANQYGVVSRNFLGFRLTTPFSSKENKILTISNPHSEK